VPLHSLNIVATDIAPIRSTAHYRRTVTTLDASLPETTGVHALKFLMDQHGIKQGELQEIGSQGVVSEILAGKRELNIRQVRALATRFGVSVATFV